MDIRENDEFMWGNSVHIKVTKVTKKYAYIICRTYPVGEMVWSKKQLLPFPDSFVPVSMNE